MPFLLKFIRLDFVLAKSGFKKILLKNTLAFYSIIIILVLLWFFSIWPVNGEEKEQKICFKDTCFSVELAVTVQERAKGLMFRKKLEKNKGMLFIFPEEQKQRFWMKNTLICLDIIGINNEKKVVFIKKYAQPCSEDSCHSINFNKEAQYVLEINGGLSDEMGLKVGDTLDFYIDTY